MQVFLPIDKKVRPSEIRDAFADVWASPVSEAVELYIPEHSGRLHASAVCALAMCLLHAKQQGRSVIFTGNLSMRNGVARYLARTNLFDLVTRRPVGLPAAQLNTRGRHYPIRSLFSTSDVCKAVDSLIEIILRQSDVQRSVVTAFEWAVNEVIDNVLVHTESPVGALVIGQTVSTPGCISVSVGDLGQGILSTLVTGYPSLKTEREAILKAVEQGVTRDKKIGQGNGLAGSRQIAAQAGGSLVISSGDWNVLFDRRGSQAWTGEGCFGTQVTLTLPTSQPIELKDTLLGDRESFYLEKMFENDTGDRVIVVAEHTGNCGNRKIGSELHNMLWNLSDQGRVGVTIDFTGIRSISSSFADEFLGKFAFRVGISRFARQFGIRFNNAEQEGIVSRALATRAQTAS